NPNSIDAIRIDASDTMDNNKDWQIVTDDIKSVSGDITYLSGINVDYGSGTFGVANIGSLNYAAPATLNYVLTCDNATTGHASWSDPDTMASNISHSSLLNLDANDHPQYLLTADFDGTADTWLGTKTSDDLTEGEVHLFLTVEERAVIASNTTEIGNNATAIGNNTTQIGTNTTNIGNNTTQIGTNTTNIGNNTSQIATNVTAIGNNTTHRGLTNNPHETGYNNLEDEFVGSGQVAFGDGSSPGAPDGNVEFFWNNATKKLAIGHTSADHKLDIVHSGTTESGVAQVKSTQAGSTSIYALTAGTNDFTIKTYGQSHSSKAYKTEINAERNLNIIASGIEAAEIGLVGTVGSGISCPTVQAGTFWGVGNCYLDNGEFMISGNKQGGTGGGYYQWGTDDEAGDTQLFVMVMGRTAGGNLYISAAEA
ncbi:MAG: hypothetical protein ACTSXD_06045, partial [Candidatus Heimdallarchaeaceae archaeon]